MANSDGRKRALLIGGGIANFTDVGATFSETIRALTEKEAKLKAARMHIYVQRGGPEYQTRLAKMRSSGEKLGVLIETMTLGVGDRVINSVYHSVIAAVLLAL